MWSHYLLSYLFPITCSGCGAWDSHLCTACQAKAFTPGVFQLSNSTIWYLGYYQNKILQTGIQDYKYHGIRELHNIFGKTLAQIIPAASYDFVIPTPLHAKRLRDRGYNQTELLAKHLGIPLLPVLQKTISTTPQAELNRQARLQNISNTISYNAKLVQLLSGKKVLLIDDVYTTGSTMAAGRTLLYHLGAQRVDGAVIAWDKI